MLHITGFADLQMRVPCIQAIQRRFMRESKLMKAAKQKQKQKQSTQEGETKTRQRKNAPFLEHLVRSRAPTEWKQKLKNRKVEGHRPAVWLATRARCGRPRSDDARLASVSKTLGKPSKASLGGRRGLQ